MARQALTKLFVFRSPELKNVSRETFCPKPQQPSADFDHFSRIRLPLSARPSTKLL
jgi:hypothetical protein